jgi:hypothetical protein
MTAAASPKFSPGFRLSALDVAVLILGAGTTAWLARSEPETAFVIGYVVGHFFLFCNVLRMARSLELIWAAVFTVLAAGTTISGWPGWSATVVGSLTTTAIVAAIELRKPSYHGLGWRRINPRLSEWWTARHSPA